MALYIGYSSDDSNKGAKGQGGGLGTFVTSEGKKIVPNKKGDIGVEVYYLCQPNTYVIAREFGEQQ